MNIERVDITSMQSELTEVRKEIAQLKRARNDIATQAQTHEELAAEPQTDGRIAAFHKKEAANLKVKVCEYDYAVASKGIDETSLDLAIEQFREGSCRKASLLRELVGQAATADLEKEIEYHAA